MADGETRRRVIETDDEDAKLVFETSEEVKVTRSFDQMKLREDLVRGIYAYGKIFFYFFDALATFHSLISPHFCARQDDVKLQTHPPSILNIKIPNPPNVDVYNLKYS